MSNDQKVMKVASLVLLAWSLAVLVFDVIAIVTVASGGWGVGGFLLVILYTFEGLFGFWVGMKGVKGANTPSKAGTFNVGALILALVEVFCLIFTLVTGTDVAGRALADDVPMVVLECIALAACLAGWFAGRRVLTVALDK